MKSSQSKFVVRAACFALLAVFAAAQPVVTVRHSNGAGGTLRGIAVGSSRLVAVGDGGLILSSPDGETWNRQDSGGNEALFGVVFSANSGVPSLFIAVGDHGTMLKSFDGDTWTAIAVPGLDARLNHVSTYGGRILAAGDNGSIVTSIDGNRWSLYQSGTTASLRAIERLNSSEVLAIGAGGAAVLGRDDGANFAPISLGVTADLQAMVSTYGSPGPLYPNVETISVGANGAYVIGTNNGSVGRKFVSYPTPTAVGLHGVAIGRTSFLVVGDRGTILLKDNPAATLPDWTTLNAATTANLNGAAFRSRNESNSFFVVGDNELILQIEEKNRTWLNNLSIRAEGGTGSRVLINGFAIGGSTAKPVLLRAAGPALRQFAIDAPMEAPTLTLFDYAGRVIARNAGWETSPDPVQLRSVAQRVGAFPFPAASADSALLLNLAPGLYTTHVTDRNGATGIALLELYDADATAAADSKFINLSARCFVGTGASIAIPGIKSRGNRMPRLLIRAVGPGLAQFGVSGFLADPKIEIIHAESILTLIGGSSIIPAQAVATNDDWNTQRSFASYYGPFPVGAPEEVRAMSARAGAFPLGEGSKDAVLLLTITPGDFSFQISGVNGSSGIALIEIYDVSDL